MLLLAFRVGRGGKGNDMDNLLEAIRSELIDSIAQAECELAAERLSGNVPKEYFWKGELAALRRMFAVVKANSELDRKENRR